MIYQLFDAEKDKDYLMFTFWRITIRLWEIKK